MPIFRSDSVAGVAEELLLKGLENSANTHCLASTEFKGYKIEVLLSQNKFSLVTNKKTEDFYILNKKIKKGDVFTLSANVDDNVIKATIEVKSPFYGRYETCIFWNGRTLI